MSFKCKIGMHSWNGCKCSVCGKIRDEQHAWRGCKCSLCGKTRDEKHAWSEDCEKCPVCGKQSGKQHKWTGCKCDYCGKIRDEGHDWSQDCEQCSQCGKTRGKAHRFVNNKCTLCGALVDCKEIISKKEIGNCLVIRFENYRERNKGMHALYKYDKNRRHLEKRVSEGKYIRYRKRSSVFGSFVVVVDCWSCFDTWHSKEYDVLCENKVSFVDIDFVRYEEIKEVTDHG